jgi:hypothetical protein
VKEKIPTIQLLIPNGSPRSIEETGHVSRWPARLNFDKLAKDYQILSIINGLIKNEQWIIEESNDLMGMLKLSV